MEQYGMVTNFPLSALAAARIYRLRGNLEAAAGREEDAIRWLKEPSVQSAEQPHAWALDSGAEEQLRLGRLEEKQCYADLELAVTKFLQDDESIATETVPSTIGHSGLCHSRRQELTDILKWELRRLGSEVPQFTNAADAFVSKFLAPNRH